MTNYKSQNKVALITGGLGNIGRELISVLSEKNINIFIIDKDINETSAKQFIDNIKNKNNISIDMLDVNLLNEESFGKIFSEFSKKYSKLDYLVNLAAFYDDCPGWGVDFEEEGYEAWLKVLKVNLMAPFFLVQKLKSLLLESKEASIVNVSSMYGVTAPDHRLYDGTDMTNPCAYSASKAGMNQVTQWLSTVLAPNIRVNTVSPGGIERGQPDKFIKKYNSKTPLGRMCTNKEVADAITFFLLGKSSYITGQNLIVDGGWTAW